MNNIINWIKTILTPQNTVGYQNSTHIPKNYDIIYPEDRRYYESIYRLGQVFTTFSLSDIETALKNSGYSYNRTKEVLSNRQFDEENQPRTSRWTPTAPRQSSSSSNPGKHIPRNYDIIYPEDRRYYKSIYRLGQVFTTFSLSDIETALKNSGYSYNRTKEVLSNRQFDQPRASRWTPTTPRQSSSSSSSLDTRKRSNSDDSIEILPTPKPNRGNSKRSKPVDIIEPKSNRGNSKRSKPVGFIEIEPKRNRGNSKRSKPVGLIASERNLEEHQQRLLESNRQNTVLQDIRKLSNDELFKELKKRGVNVGPVSLTTRKIYEKKLESLILTKMKSKSIFF